MASIRRKNNDNPKLDFELPEPRWRFSGKSGPQASVFNNFERTMKSARRLGLGKSKLAERREAGNAYMASQGWQEAQARIGHHDLGSSTSKRTGRPIDGVKLAASHVNYMQRDESQPDGHTPLFNAQEVPPERVQEHSDALAKELKEPLRNEQSQFRLILNPENGHQLDLEAYTRAVMKRIEQDTGHKLNWAATQHHDTAKPHVHVLIRGIDRERHKVNFSIDYATRGLTRSAREVATHHLGPVTESERVKLYKRELRDMQLTHLDEEIARIARPDGSVPPKREWLSVLGDRQTVKWVEKRLGHLRDVGLAQRKGFSSKREVWRVTPEFRDLLRQAELRREAYTLAVKLGPYRPNRVRVIDPLAATGKLDRSFREGFSGVVKWHGLDESGRHVAVIESGGGVVYHTPIPEQAAAELKVGRIVEVSERPHRDDRIQELARGGSIRAADIPEPERETLKARLGDLRAMGLATANGPDSWSIPNDLAKQAREAEGPRAVRDWQRMRVRVISHELERQPDYHGRAWIDGVNLAKFAQHGWGAKVHEAAAQRAAFYQREALDPQSPKLRWELLEMQRVRLGAMVAEKEIRRLRKPGEITKGRARVLIADNGERFVILRDEPEGKKPGNVVVHRLGKQDPEAIHGKLVQVHPEGKAGWAFEVLPEKTKAKEAERVQEKPQEPKREPAKGGAAAAKQSSPEKRLAQLRKKYRGAPGTLALAIEEYGLTATALKELKSPTLENRDGTWFLVSKNRQAHVPFSNKKKAEIGLRVHEALTRSVEGADKRVAPVRGGESAALERGPEKPAGRQSLGKAPGRRVVAKKVRRVKARDAMAAELERGLSHERGGGRGD